jgi:hypothetical protein
VFFLISLSFSSFLLLIFVTCPFSHLLSTIHELVTKTKQQYDDFFLPSPSLSSGPGSQREQAHDLIIRTAIATSRTSEASPSQSVISRARFLRPTIINNAPSTSFSFIHNFFLQQTCAQNAMATKTSGVASSLPP